MSKPLDIAYIRRLTHSAENNGIGTFHSTIYELCDEVERLKSSLNIERAAALSNSEQLEMLRSKLEKAEADREKFKKALWNVYEERWCNGNTIGDIIEEALGEEL